MAKPATLRVDVVADTRDASSKLDNFSGKVAGFTAGITAAVGSFAIDKAAEAVTNIAGAITTGIQSAASLSASLATLAKNYGEGAASVEAWAKNAATSLGLSELAAIQAANGFAVYTRALGISGQEATDFSTGLTQLAADLAAYNDLTTAEAIQAIGSAFRGERDPLERFGILLNDAQVKAAYFRRTGEEVNGTLTTQQNILGTLQALYEQGAPALGAFASESDQLGNKTQVLGARLDDLKTAIGERLLPYVVDLATWAQDKLLPALENLGRWVGDELLPRFVDFVNWIKQSVIPSLRDLWDWIERYVGPVFEKLANWFTTDLLPRLKEFWQLIQENLLPLFERLWDSVTRLWGSMVELWDKLEPVRELIGKIVGPLIGGALLSLFAGLYSGATILNVVISALSGVFGVLGTAVSGIIQFFKDLYGWLEDVWDFVFKLWENSPLQKIIEGVKGIIGWITDQGSGVDQAFERAKAAAESGGNVIIQNNTIQVPPGALGQDSGAIIAKALEDAYARGQIGNIFG